MSLEIEALSLPPKETENGARSSLVGGPLHRAAMRFGLVRNGSNSILLGIGIGFTLWVTIVLLALARGVLAQIFVLPLIAAHVRLLIVIPLFFITETLIEPPIARFLGGLVHSEIVPDSERPKVVAAITGLRKRADSALSDILCLILAVALTLTGARMPRYAEAGTSAALHDPFIVAAYTVLAGTVFRFLLFRWILRIGLWCWFLWRLSKIKLHLLAGHSDRAGGLGALEVIHSKFAPLFVGLAALESALFAQELAHGMPFVAMYPLIAIAVAINVILVFTPLLLFTPALIQCRGAGYFTYMALASRYLDRFERRWFSDQAPNEELIGAADLQSLADLTNSIEVMRSMRIVPAGMGLIKTTVMASLIPLLPLVLFRYSTNRLLEKLAERFLGT